MTQAAGTERRVYNMPIGLLQRVREFQKERGMLSESEAVRALLINGLNAKPDGKKERPKDAD